MLSCSLQTFESPVSFHNADVGRCVANELFNVTDTNGATLTTDVPTFTVVLTHPEPSWTTTTRPTGPTLVKQLLYILLLTGIVLFSANSHPNSHPPQTGASHL